jgi:alcohol dehydrogenase class IV
VTSHFEFATAGRIVFGAGVLGRTAGALGALGRRPLVVTGASTERAQPLLALLVERGALALTFPAGGEPDVAIVRSGAAFARKERCDAVIGFGGGAALDAAKAIAILATNPGDVLDYLEIVGRGRTLTELPLPCAAIPTTAGTGAEVTRNSVIASHEHRVKVSLRHPTMLPGLAVVDPELTYGLPAGLTAITGLDALTQVIEPFVCTKANPLVDGLCREGMMRVARSLRAAVAAAAEQALPGAGAAPALTTAEAVAAREDMALASLFGGLALANAGLGAVHGIAGPLGGMIEAPHGALCAALLPAVVDMNLRALRQRAPAGAALARYAAAANLLTGDPYAAAEDVAGWLRTLVTDLGIPGLAAWGVVPRMIGELAGNAARANSMKANPVELTLDQLEAIVEAAL